MIEVKDLKKDYHGHKALCGVDLSFAPGEVVGLFGPNGSGKTTLIKILANLLMKYDGEVLIDGKKPSVETKEIVSYLPDVNYLEDEWKVSYAIKVFKTFYKDFDEEKATSLIEKFGIDKNYKVAELSKGNKEKLQVILVLSRHAKVYLFDEPIAGVDPAGRDFIFNLIKENYDQSATVILTTHLIADIEDVCDRIVFIHKGKIVLNNTKDELAEKYPGYTIDEIFRGMFRMVN